MRARWLTAVLCALTIASAHAQQAPPTPQPLPRPTPQQPAPRPLPAPQIQVPAPNLQSYEYTALTTSTVRRSGAVTAAALTWNCSGTRCTIRGPWLLPGVPACAALAREVGPITSYGRSGAMLTPAQIAECNASAAPGEIAITTSTIRAQGSPDAGAPAPFTPFAITTSTVRAQGSPDAGAPTFAPVTITTSTIRAQGVPR